MRELAQREQTEEKRAVFQSAMQLFSDNVIQYELDTQILTDAIIFAGQGAVHPRFISPAQIRQSGILATEVIPDTAFPISGESVSISETLAITELSVMLADYRLVYRLSFPLLDRIRYKIYKAHPFPAYQSAVNMSNTFAYIWPDSQYFAINRTSLVYIPMSVESLDKCKRLTSYKRKGGARIR